MTLENLVATVTAIGTVIAASAAALAARSASSQVKALRVQIEQANAEALAKLSNDHNWQLLDRHSSLPPALPSWRGQDTVAWTWRVLHMNHLNLLQLARETHARGLMAQSSLESWLLKGRYWFRSIWPDTQDQELHQGREILRQLLRPEEGYPRDFRQWLVDNTVIPPDLVSD